MENSDSAVVFSEPQLGEGTGDFQFHQGQLKLRCRVCGRKPRGKTPASVSRCADELLLTYNLDIRGDSESCHPKILSAGLVSNLCCGQPDPKENQERLRPLLLHDKKASHLAALSVSFVKSGKGNPWAGVARNRNTSVVLLSRERC